MRDRKISEHDIRITISNPDDFEVEITGETKVTKKIGKETLTVIFVKYEEAKEYKVITAYFQD